MIALVGDTTAPQSLQIVLTAAPAAELAWMSSYADLTDEDIVLLNENGTTNSTTAVDIVTAPEDGSDYQLKAFYTKNQNAAAVTVIIQLDDNGTTRELIRVTLNQHDTLEYIDTEGFKVIDVNGNIKTTFGGLIVEESDGSPSLTAIRNLQTDAATISVTSIAAGVARITGLGGSAIDNDARILAWILSK